MLKLKIEQRRRRWQHQVAKIGKCNGTSVDGIRGEHADLLLDYDSQYLPLILHAWTDELLTRFVRQWFRATKGLAINKNDKQTKEVIGFRPLGITSFYRRLLSHEPCKTACAEYSKYMVENGLYGCGAESGIELPATYWQMIC